MPATESDMRFPERLATLAERVKGFLPEDEGLALHAAASAAAQPGGVIVEIGSYCGKSTLYLGHVASVIGASVVTIDHHRGSEEHQIGWEYHDASLVDPETGLFDTLPTLRRTLVNAGIEEFVVPMIGRSSTIARWWRTPIDFLFIDGGHTDEAARADLDGWARWIRAGGTLAIHDVFPDPADGGQAPYRIFRAALDSGEFVEDCVAGSLRLLHRV